MKITTLRVGQMAANCYLLIDEATSKTLIIDPGDDAEYIMDTLTRLSADPQAIIATHGHFDHVMAARALQLAYTVPFFVHPLDAFLIDRMKETAEHFLGHTDIDPAAEVTPLTRDNISVGESSLEIFHSPGHTPGSIVLYDKRSGTAFVGDTLFAGGAMGRTDFSYSRPLDLARSVERILALPEATALLAGHGESTVVRYEKTFHKGG